MDATHSPGFSPAQQLHQLKQHHAIIRGGLLHRQLWSIVPKGSDDRIIAVHLLVVVVERIGAANLGLLFPQAAFEVGLFLPQFAEGRAVGLVLAFDVVLLLACRGAVDGGVASSAAFVRRRRWWCEVLGGSSNLFYWRFATHETWIAMAPTTVTLVVIG